MAITGQPLTSARLASSIELKVMIPVEINTGFGIYYEFKPGLTLGTVGRMTRNQTRELKRRYTLGRNAFEPLDVIPGRVITDLTLEKVIMYSEYLAAPVKGDVASLLGLQNGAHLSDGDLLGALGYVSGSLFFQQFPFAIEEVVHPPEGLTGNPGPTTTTYYDCWLRTNPIDYDLTGRDQLVIQECDVVCGKVATSIPFSKATVPLVRSLLPNKVKIGSF